MQSLTSSTRLFAGCLLQAFVVRNALGGMVLCGECDAARTLELDLRVPAGIYVLELRSGMEMVQCRVLIE